MSDFRCPNYWWDGNNWRCKNLPNDYLNVHDFDTYCTNKYRCLECPYMDSEVREKVAAYKKEVDERVEEHVEEQRREYEAEQRNKENDYSYRENNNTSSTTTYSSSGSSDTGCLGSLFSLIGLLIMGILKLLFYFYKFVFLYLVFPVWSTATVYYFSILIITGILGVLPAIALVLGVIESVLVLISLPYWVILFIQKKKRRMTWKETFKYYGKWFIKGPWAYKDIIELKNKPMSF